MAIEKIGTFGFAVIWVGMAIVLAAFAIGGGAIQSLPLGTVIVATIIGSVAIGILMTIVGDIGVEHGLSFPVYMRAPFGTLAQPWSLFDVLNQALLVIGGILTSIVGILFVDYYILRKRRVNVYDLYEMDGQFKYMGGFNLAGMISWIVGGIIANLLPTYSAIVGFVVGAILYYFLAKYWWFKIYKQAEIENPSDEKYLGITVGRDWDLDAGEKMVVSTDTVTKNI